MKTEQGFIGDVILTFFLFDRPSGQKIEPFIRIRGVNTYIGETCQENTPLPYIARLSSLNESTGADNDLFSLSGRVNHGRV